ncbi:MAG: hypothetical protein FWE18_02460 [Alphaproteobacteria bacterium]|nr:hypothetical protein [Alphaproteobacteria bacterium]
MSLFGYNLNTNPQLQKLYDKGEVYLFKQNVCYTLTFVSLNCMMNLRNTHIPYDFALENKFKKFPQDYDNKILQTDNIYADIIEFLAKEKTPIFAILTADHGESLGEVYKGRVFTAHGVSLDIAPIEQKQTPLIVYVNDAYKKLYPQYVKNIEKNMKKYAGKTVESDVISHSLLHCSSIEGTVIDKKLSLCVSP